MANEKNKTTTTEEVVEQPKGKKKNKYVIETTEPLVDGQTYQMTFRDKRAK